jgi:hypothetical protein
MFTFKFDVKPALLASLILTVLISNGFTQAAEPKIDADTKNADQAIVETQTTDVETQDIEVPPSPTGSIPQIVIPKSYISHFEGEHIAVGIVDLTTTD